MKGIIVFCLFALTLAAQDSTGSGAAATRGVTAASQFFEHDFVNLYAFANGVWDSRLPEVTNGTSTVGAGLGWEAGGGITASHQFKGGDVTLNYMGSYRDYGSAGYSSGIQQSLSLGFYKAINRRWSITSSVSGGILSYGTGYYGGSVGVVGNAANPFSSRSRFLNGGLSLTYAQTRRLSWVFSGNGFLSNYNYGGAISSYGGSGGLSMLYRTTARTTLGVNYTHTYYTYSATSGDSQIDGLNLSVSHLFPNHWQVDLSAGANRSHSKGVLTIPLSVILDGQVAVPIGFYCGQLATGIYCIGPYDRTTISPAFQAAITHYLRHQSFSVSGGQSIQGGNGIYLTSRVLFANALYSYSTRHSNLSFGGYYSHLTSLANTISDAFSTAGASASYGIYLASYISANFRYDFVHYDTLFGSAGVNESRLTFGLSLSTKKVPLTLF